MNKNNHSINRRVAERLPDQGHLPKHYRRPFWLPAGSYYFLSVGLAIILFFIIWQLFELGGDKSPWIASGMLAGAFMVFSVYLREIVLRNALNRYLAVQRKLDKNLTSVRRLPHAERPRLSLSQNKLLLEDIERKSEATQTLKQLPDAHLEIFELCDDYLQLTKKELQQTSVNSPRFGPIRRGRQKVRKLHKYHLLAWAQIESNIYTREASRYENLAEKIGSAKSALEVINTASSFYPHEKQLTDSAEVIREFISSAKITDSIRKAEYAAADNEYRSAIIYYKDALYNLAGDEIKYRNKDAAQKKINEEIIKLQEILYKSAQYDDAIK